MAAAETTRYLVLQAALAAIRTKINGTGIYWNTIKAGQVTDQVVTADDRISEGYDKWVGVYLASEGPDTVEITQRSWMRHLGIEVLVITAETGVEEDHERW